MTNKWTKEPYSITADLYGPGLEAQLVLHIPNTKDIDSIEDCEFFKRFKDLEHQRIDDLAFGMLLSLQHEIEEYCQYSSFVTYESTPALKLYVRDFRDDVIKCMR